MLPIVLTILVGLLGGVFVGVQGPMVGVMSQRIGGAAGSFVTHVGGTVASGLLLVARRGEAIADWRSLPWYMLGAGVWGLLFYLTITYTLPRLGAVSAIALVIIGELVTGAVIDQFSLFGVAAHPLDGYRVAGMVLLVAGGYLIGK